MTDIVDDEPMDDMEEDYVPEGGIRIGDIYIPPPPPAACTLDNNGPRLIITHIENEFFKSYAGKQVLGPFHKSFTSIVGPNGSGKSNVIDSMLFVFGYKASKIRSKKLSVLIHNSNTHPNVQSCRVAVHFQAIIDKGDDFEVVPNTQFNVARTAMKDNSSFYQLNGKRVQYKEVAKMLRGKGIDLDHNRFLILQGEVESISLMKPKGLTEHDTGMLEFLEDIIGTSRFKVPIDLLSKKVEELNELRVEKLNRVKLVEKEKDELEGPMKNALGFLRMENEKVEKTYRQRSRYILDAETNITKATEKKTEIEESVSDLTKKMKEINDKRKEKDGEMKEKGESFETVQKEIEDLSEKFKKFELEDTSLREDLKNTNVKRKKQKQLAEAEKAKQEKLIATPEENKKKIEECMEMKTKLEKKVDEEEVNYETAMASLKNDTQVFQDEKAKHESKLVDLKKTVNEAQAELDLATNEHEVYISAEVKEKNRLEDLKTRIQNTKDSVKGKAAKLVELEDSVPAKEQELNGASGELERVSGASEQAKERLQVMRFEYEEKKSAQNASKSHGQVHDALMQQKTNGNIPGIIGRVGDLGGIDKKYDCAVSTAGGGNLDTILVEDGNTGKQCIEFLRQNNVGRGNFLALDRTKGKYDRNMQPMDTPMGVPRLFDLITVADERYRSAFYHYIRDTLVATDMDQATKVAYGARRFRVVTLGGELIETSGTMSGGGRNKMTGKMGQQVQVVDKVNPKEFERMERGISEVDQEAKECNKRRQELEDILYKGKKEILEMKKQQGKLRVEVNPLKEQVVMMEKQVADQENRVKEAAPDKKVVKEMQTRMAAAQEVYDEANDKAQVVQKEVKACDVKIKEITGGKIKSVQKKLDDAKKQLDKIKTEMTRLEVEIKSATRNLKKCTEKVESLEAEVKECEDGMRAMTERRTLIEADGGKLLEETQQKQEESKQLREAIGKLKVEADEISKEENTLKSSRIEVDQQLQKWDDLIKDNSKKVNYWKREMKKLELQEVPGEEVTALTDLTNEEILAINMEELTYELNLVEEKLAASKPNMAAIAEYKKKEEVYLDRVAELDKMTSARDEQRKHHDDLRKQRLNDFMEGFAIITGKLKEMYQMITLGGDAELELVDSLDPFAEGIVFSVRPPKKSWKNISNLSGGEKTLSSLALVFALHYYKPTPLYVMDEIDAALDFKNVSIVANYIKERTRNAQFIIISLRSNMFELADRLVGIYKTYNCTKSVTINPHLIELSPPHPQPNLTQTPAKASLSQPAVVPLGENNSNASNTVQAMEVA
eukprot:TRINITY_DN42055_c0_g1_i1.p1 TRINITY_DN42055_c0_g1~~TRINITY_DN42055_c0_g1_i1.p1  ORF type:complete len:1294 (+),score=513.23 TRINITY_DN42055_c0_g1_i1:38-3919(+)